MRIELANTKETVIKRDSEISSLSKAILDITEQKNVDQEKNRDFEEAKSLLRDLNQSNNIMRLELEKLKEPNSN